jgi:SAM-dependent methyltransferase
VIDVSAEQACALALPWADGTVAALRLDGVFHRLTAAQRIHFMEEAWRVLRPGGTLDVTAPHARGDAAHVPGAAWPPLVESSFLYFDAEARADMRVGHYAIRCDFAVEIGLRLEPQWTSRPEAEKLYAARHYHGAVAGMTAFLTKRSAP